MSLETVQHLKTHLEELLETAQNPKILWEEMTLVAQRAFQLQAEAAERLSRLEAEEKDIARLSVLFDLREEIWDLADKLARRELEVKEKTFCPAKDAANKAACRCKESDRDGHTPCCRAHDAREHENTGCRHEHGCCHCTHEGEDA